MNTEQTLEKLRQLKPELRRSANVSALALFGSRAKRDARPDSDIDVLVEFSDSSDIFAFLRLREYLSVRLGAKVDLVSKRALHPAVKERVLSEAIYV